MCSPPVSQRSKRRGTHCTIWSEMPNAGFATAAESKSFRHVVDVLEKSVAECQNRNNANANGAGAEMPPYSPPSPRSRETFEAMNTQTGIELIAAERQRQITVEGYDAAHDAAHIHGEIAKAAACYADFACPTEERIKQLPLQRGLADPETFYPLRVQVPVNWPWATEYWKPSPESRIRELVKAGALIAAEIDRLQRLGGTP